MAGQSAKDPQAVGPRKHAVFRRIGPCIPAVFARIVLRLRRYGTGDQSSCLSGKWVLRQKILQRFPDEDWRIKLKTAWLPGMP